MSEIKTDKQVTPIDPKATPLESLQGRRIYHTTYKKGQLLASVYFEHDGGFEQAVNDVKLWCSNKSLRHIHTVPFLVNIKETMSHEND